MSSREDGNMVYNKKKGGVNSLINEIWDDTELIAMYNKSTAKTYEKVQNAVNSTGGTSNSTSPKQKRKWNVGDVCMAPYAEDGMWYKACIVSLSKNTCRVCFTEYDTEASANLDDLMTEEEVELVGGGDVVDEEKQQGETAMESDMQQKQQPSNATKALVVPDICPPPPPSIFDKIVVATSEKEALTNSLMGWYMAGYHTGFYQGLKHQKPKQSPSDSEHK